MDGVPHLTWVLDDWRLSQDASISEDFGNMHDVSHNGCLGNTATVNGRILETFPVKSGERIRFRLINTANARVFGLRFRGLRPVVIAYDGQPVTPHEAPEDGVVPGPAMRVDVVLDLTGNPGERFEVVDAFYPRRAYRLLALVYDVMPLRDGVPDTPMALPANTSPEPDPANAERHDIVLGGGAMGSMRAAVKESSWKGKASKRFPRGGNRVDPKESVR